jgi:tyrosinase
MLMKRLFAPNVCIRAGSRTLPHIPITLKGFNIAHRYWQEQRDAGAFKRSVVLDPVYGFGGDGSGVKGCITNGPFVNYTNHLGPSYEITDHCIDRRLDDTTSQNSSQKEVDNCLAKTDWLSAWSCIEAAPHRGGHGGVGGQVCDEILFMLLHEPLLIMYQMLNGVSSPGDPLFYLHHTWLDKIWADWQNLNPSKRLTEIGGSNVMPRDKEATFIPRPSSIPRPTGADGDPGTNTTLTHILNMYGNGPNRTIADVMDIGGAVLCYKYIGA